MKKCIIFSILFLFIGNAIAMACCYTSKRVHNNTGVDAWDIVIMMAGRRTVVNHYDGNPNGLHFRQFSTWQAQLGGQWYTYMRWFDPADGNTPGPIPFCSYVRIGYYLNKPAKYAHGWWTDAGGGRIPNGHIQQPSHWVRYWNFADRLPRLILSNDFAEIILADSIIPGCPEPTLLSNFYYGVFDAEIPLDSLSGDNPNLLGLTPVGPPSIQFDSVGQSYYIDINEPIEEGQYLVYRFEGGITNDYMDYGQHEMERKVPSLTEYGVIVLVALLLLSGIFVLYRRRRATAH